MEARRTLAEITREQEAAPFLPFPPDDDVQRRFQKFHNENPHVYRKLLQLARQVQERGFRNYSIWALFSRLRWHYDFETQSEDGFKLCNDFTSRYSRMLMENEPELAGFFRIRPLKSERKISQAQNIA